MKRLALLLILLACPALAEPSVEVAFSPGDAAQAVVRVISSAERTVHVAAYSFTSKPIAQALVAAKKRGVLVAAVLDKSNLTGRYSAATFLSRQGIPVRINYRYAIMHNKMLIADGVTVQTGSFNYTSAGALSNAENILILRGHPEVARQYEAEWNRLWNESTEYLP